MSDEQTSQETEVERRPGNEAPTGWHLYEGQEVMVQLFEPYIAGMNEKGEPIGTPILKGTVNVKKGAGDNGQLLFVLATVQVRPDGSKAETFITIQPGDVKHFTHIDEPNKPRIVQAP
jgi:hypothetical protein